MTTDPQKWIIHTGFQRKCAARRHVLMCLSNSSLTLTLATIILPSDHPFFSQLYFPIFPINSTSKAVSSSPVYTDRFVPFPFKNNIFPWLIFSISYIVSGLFLTSSCFNNSYYLAESCYLLQSNITHFLCPLTFLEIPFLLFNTHSIDLYLFYLKTTVYHHFFKYFTASYNVFYIYEPDWFLLLI